MSHALSYREPNKLPAGLLALAVHVAFILLLMFGMRWQARPPEAYSVDLWDSLPVTEQAPVLPAQPAAPAPMPVQPTMHVPAPAPVPVPVVKAEPPPPVKADIVLREKKVSKVEPVKPTEQEIKSKQDQEIKAKQEQEFKVKQDQEEQRQMAEYAAQRRQDVQARVRADIDAATTTEVERYTGMISSKIQHNIKGDWSRLPATTVAEYRVTLLPDGTVMDEPVLQKSSGNQAYDDAVARAILSAQPFKLPPDEGLKKSFRNLHLIIRPKEE